MSLLALSFLAISTQGKIVSVTDPCLQLSPYNWIRKTEYVQTPNPGAYLRLGFTGTSIRVNLDNATFTNVPASRLPLIRYSIDNGPGITVQLKAGQQVLECANAMKDGAHTLQLSYVSGYVFLDFWTPLNVIRVTGFTIDAKATTLEPTKLERNALFLGDSITNGNDNTANFKDGITNEVDTQDATIGYPSVVAAATKSEYGVVAYGGASWDRTAADGNTPGLMTFWDKIDKDHSRLVNGKFNPIPDDIYINMGENRPPSTDDVYDLIVALQRASDHRANLFLIVPFSGRARQPIFRAWTRAQQGTGLPSRVFLIDLGDNPHLQSQGKNLFSVDGQHPLAALHGQLGAQIVAARAKRLAREH